MEGEDATTMLENVGLREPLFVMPHETMTSQSQSKPENSETSSYAEQM